MVGCPIQSSFWSGNTKNKFVNFLLLIIPVVFWFVQRNVYTRAYTEINLGGEICLPPPPDEKFEL